MILIGHHGPRSIILLNILNNFGNDVDKMLDVVDLQLSVGHRAECTCLCGIYNVQICLLVSSCNPQSIIIDFRETIWASKLLICLITFNTLIVIYVADTV